MTLSWGAAGSVTGAEHLRVGRDGQDGFALLETAEVTAAIVTDGCSSGRSSEVGARLGAAWLATLIAERFASVDDLELAARDVTRGLVTRIAELARTLTPALQSETLLFSFLAAVVTPSAAIVFGVGDGVVWVDGVRTVIDPGPDNAPAYPAYALTGADVVTRIHHLGAARRIAVATDGLGALDAAETCALMSHERYADNPSLLKKKLTVLAANGRFTDDATVAIVVRGPS